MPAPRLLRLPIRSLVCLLEAAAPPLAAAALVTAAVWLKTTGPVPGWVGFLLDICAVALWLAALGVLFLASRFLFAGRERPISAVVSGLLLAVSLYGLDTGMQQRTLQERGGTAVCAVLEVDRRVETRSAADPGSATSMHTGVHGPMPPPPQPPTHTPSPPRRVVYYDHRLDCAEAPEMTTRGGPAAEAGERIEVAYDTADRLDTRPAGKVNPEPRLWLFAVAFVLGLVLRLWPGFETAAQRTARGAVRGYRRLAQMRKERGKDPDSGSPP